MPSPLRLLRVSALALALVASLLLAASAQGAKAYATDRCVSEKLKAVSKTCKSVLKAQARFAKKGDAARRDAALAKARTKLASHFGKAEGKVASDVDCAETTAAPAEVSQLVEDAAQALSDAVIDGLAVGDKGQAKCAGRILGAAEKACAALLKAESKHMKDRRKDRDQARLRQGRDKADAKLASAFAKALSKGACPTTATAGSVATQVEGLVGDATLAQIVSPAVDDVDFTNVVPGAVVEYEGQMLEPSCGDGAPWSFWVRRGSVNKVVMYYQGGGACWNYLTCVGFPTFKQGTDADDDPANFTTGFADAANPENPFVDWHMVFIPYCTGDVHWGDSEITYTSPDGMTVQDFRHVGAVNAKVAEKWAREHFVNPEQVFVTGSSAGAYGAIANSARLMEFAWPSSEFAVLGDAGNGVVTGDFLANDLGNWQIDKNLPEWVPGLDVPLVQLTLADAYVSLANHYPTNRFGTYTAAYDGGSGGQTGFFNIMVNDGSPFAGLTWWNSTCAWNQGMRDLNDIAVAGAPNYRYYVGPGSSHTMWGRERVYLEVEAGQPRIVDWVSSMVAGDAGWVNTECVDCGQTFDFMNGDRDPLPDTLPEDPFDVDGNIVCAPAP